jgi:transcriptional regulator with XRE-family HTH domain
MPRGRLPKSLYSETYSRFLTLLKRARLESGLTQIEVAERLGRPQSFVSKCESGERRVDVAEFLAFCTVLRTDPASFLRRIARHD